MPKKVNDDLIDDLLKAVEEKKSQIEKIKNPEFKTNLSFPMDAIGISARLNLNVMPYEQLYFLLVLCENMVNSSDALTTKYGFTDAGTYAGYKWTEWRDDIVLQIKKKQVQTAIKELKVIEDQLSALMSDEKKKSLELERIKKTLGL